MRPLVCAALLLAVTAAGAAARTDTAVIGCAEQSIAAVDGAFTRPDNVIVRPLSLLALRRARSATQADLERTNGFWKSPVVLRPGHRAVVRVDRGSRDEARVRWDPRADERSFGETPFAARFRACPAEDARSRDRGRPVTFWAGGLLLARTPACIRLTVRIDRRRPRHLRVPVGRAGCRR